MLWTQIFKLKEIFSVCIIIIIGIAQVKSKIMFGKLQL